MKKRTGSSKSSTTSLLNEAMLRWFNDLAPQGILTTDAQLNIHGWNRWLEINSGLSAEEAIGKNLFTVYPELVTRGLDKHFQDALEGRVRVLSHRFHRYLLPMRSGIAGSPFANMQQSVRIAPLVEKDRVVGTIAVIDDVTERVMREEERAQLLEQEQRARKQAEAANRTKDQFLATVSHELRTPLNAMLGYAQILRRSNIDEATMTRALESIERNARAQSQLIEDLLDISRIITGKLRLNVRYVDVIQVIEAAINVMRPAAEAKGIRIQSVLDPLAGPVSGDPDRLQQVVWNLLSNAIKFTPKGGRVQVRLERINSHIEIIVSDTGVGIAEAFLPFVFDRFSQADSSSTRTHAGLGLGLSISRNLVELHGGTISVASEGEGRGASFTVSLPISAARLDTGDLERTHPTAYTEVKFDPDPILEGLLVLIVDDDTDARELLFTILKQCGAEVAVAGSADEAIEMLGQLEPDAIISDVEMPGEDGYSFIRRVRSMDDADSKKIPAAALTAHARVEDRQRALFAGFQAHIAKPVEPSELVAVIASLTERTGKG